MTIHGIGTDIAAVARLRALFERHGERALEKLLAVPELEEFAKARDPGRFLAKRFAAKEAFLKAAGTGLREPFSLCEIEAVRLESGAPAYHFSGQTAEWMQAHGLAARLSLSHEGGMALAFCTLETL